MSKFVKRLIAASICAGLSACMLTGCSSLNKNKVLMSVDGTDVTLGQAAFRLRFIQWNTENMLGGLFPGQNLWEQDLSGSGTPYGDTAKSQVLAELQEMVLTEQHAGDYGVTLSADEETAIAEAARAFLDANSADTLKAMYADEETVVRVLTLMTIHEKVEEAIRAEADTNVTEKEAAQKTIQYALFSTAGTTDEDGNTTELTDEEKEEIHQQALDVIEAVNGGKTLEDAVHEIDEQKNVITNSYGTDDTVLNENIKKAADQLEDGELAEEPVETDGGWYVVQMVSTFDEEATEERKVEIVQERQSEHLTEVLDGWTPENVSVDNDLWSKITFDVTFYKEPETETGTEGAETETVSAETETNEAAQTETETATEQEAQSETETASEA